MMKKFLFLSIMALSACGPQEKALSDFTQALESNGFVLGKKGEKFYSMINAIDGYSIEIDGDSIEIYQFDVSIKSGKQAINKLSKDGIAGKRALINDNLLLVEDINHAKWLDISRIFNEL